MACALESGTATCLKPRRQPDMGCYTQTLSLAAPGPGGLMRCRGPVLESGLVRVQGHSPS